MSVLLSGDPVPVSRLLPETKPDSLTETLRDIARRAQSNMEEKGLQTLFVALGFATWRANDGGRDAEAPVILLPVSVKHQPGSSSFSLSRNGDMQVNLVLLHVLQTQFGIRISQEELIRDLQGDDEGEAFDPTPVYRFLENACKELSGFQVKHSAIFGNFSFQKMPMVKDLLASGDELCLNDVVSAIAGDSSARTAASARAAEIDPRELDTIPPDDEFLVLDADSSQQTAIAAVGAGQNSVIHGPPGTGKSQTIANLIAALTSEGKKVLFVAEKRAALEVVLRRLKEVGLGHLVIDLHGADVSPKRVMQQIAVTLDAVRTSTLPEYDDLHRKFVNRRERLNLHVQRMHTAVQPLGTTIYQMQGWLLRHPRHQSEVRWSSTALKGFSHNVVERVRELLEEAAAFEELFTRTHPSPWTGASLTDGTAVRRAIDLSHHVAKSLWPKFRDALKKITTEGEVRPPLTLNEAVQWASMLGEINQTLSTYDPQYFRQDLAALTDVLGVADRGILALSWAFVFDSQFRQLRGQALSTRTTGKASVQQLLQESRAAANQKRRWEKYSTSSRIPKKIPDLRLQLVTIHDLAAAIRDLSGLLARQLGDLPLEELESTVLRLQEDVDTPHEIPRLMEIERELKELNAEPIILELRESHPPADQWPNMFVHALYTSVLDQVAEADSQFRGFKGKAHSLAVDEFWTTDEERVQVAAARVQRLHAERAIRVMNDHPEQQFRIRAEAQKKSRHLPLRKVFAEAAEVLTAVCPCWMASPLSVSQLLDSKRRYFDYVIFDEASQILPEDAVCSILRGHHVVVAGDKNQLPPTTFFAALEEERAEEEATAAEGFESLLDIMTAFLPSYYLDWHYRSRDESLISFSNHHIYIGRLVTFPGIGGAPAIRHELVQQPAGIDGEEESSGAEVRRLVELVIEHAQERPAETLGVIAMGIKHADRIQHALDRELDRHPELAAYFDTDKSERFFVKNLERVQGDERDAIILSIGYGKDRSGKVPFRFGPLLTESGRRRLNVAVTRARQRLTLVSSFTHLDLDLSRVRPGSGVELLRHYLQYAASNGSRLGDGVLSGASPNDFEMDVYEALSAQGIRLVHQLGASRFRIDLVALHPEKPGRFVLAIECDGASYHSSYTARDRDRLRQQHLEGLGWRFHRIWSTDWFLRKSEELARAVKAFHEAVKHADDLDAGVIMPNGTELQENEASLDGRATIYHRAARPKIPLHTSITSYSVRELVQLVQWINSDGQLRTDDEILAEIIPALGFARRGARIETAIRHAINTWRNQRLA